MPLTHSAFDHIDGLSHGFFTRNGGTSSNVYQSLNCGFGSQDDKSQVEANRASIAQKLGIAASNLSTVYQVHSPDCVAISAPFPGSGTQHAQAPKADAIATATPELGVGVLTADCGPLLFADSKNRVVAAAHAGWRGAFSGVIENTLEAMTALGAQKSSIIAILGPTISVDNYEVDMGFRTQFLEQDPSNARFFQSGAREGHLQFDLPAYIMARLEAAKVGERINLARCTYGEEDTFFSFRRSTHKNEPDYGRQLSAIALL